MYFITFVYDKVEQIGILDNSKSRVFKVNELFKILGISAPKTMNDFINIFDDYLYEKINKLICRSDITTLDINEVKLLSPIPYPNRNLFCLGKNYIEHAEEIATLAGANEEIPKFPIYFSKIANPTIGTGEIVKLHKDLVKYVDYEVELAVIISRDGINIDPKDVYEYIFGYTIVNDVSARDLQQNHSQWLKGKSLETFCPMGPVIMHKHSVEFPPKLKIVSKVNGEIRQNSNTGNLIFDIPYIISDLSKNLMLKKGDIIITGTPSGVGYGFTPPKYLKSGDIVECYIEKIGTLVNEFK